tara:strand:+ start:9517 stop:10542 length:1026 start_codon:yes stop_codon:yes gene_type:complete
MTDRLPSSSPPSTFFCVDAHTCGNPVRVVAGGGPVLTGQTMSDCRQDFLQHHDWVRRALMFEPRGHDVMSGSILYPPRDPANDLAILFIETSGCLPMCGHGTIGTATVALERGLVRPRTEGLLKLEVPAGLVTAEFGRDGQYIDWVRLKNVPAYLDKTEVKVDCPGLGEIVADISYGGNFYAIVEPQKNYPGLENVTADHILRYSPLLRQLFNQAVTCQHPENPTIQGVSHLLWTGQPTKPQAHARNAVFYGDKAIDRSPCGTGTSARMAQLFTRGELSLGDDFVHESIIGSLFEGRVEERLTLAGKPAIRPSIKGWARITGLNTIFVDDRDPFAHGFSVT